MWPRLRPEIMGTQRDGVPADVRLAMPAAARMGAMRREVLSPTPPVECLSTVNVCSGAASKTSPEKRMALVSVASSRRERPC